MFVFEETGKMEHPEKKLFEACQHWVLNPEDFGRRAGLKSNPIR